MSLILNIDTATENAVVCLGKNGRSVALVTNETQKDHAAWLHVAIEKMFRDAGLKLTDLQALAVVEGPGSYTGLRVGMATAKGLCFALQIPLLTENTLKVMAHSVLSHVNSDPSVVLCPMLDARRMEVYCALYTPEMIEIVPPVALVLNQNSFYDYLKIKNIVFFGNGSSKWKSICTSDKARFIEISYSSSSLSLLSYQKFLTGEFSDLIYTEPLYLKEFYSFKKNVR